MSTFPHVFRKSSSKEEILVTHFYDKSQSFQTPIDPYSMFYLESAIVASILEDVITQLRILGESNSGLRVYKATADIDILRAKKYSVAQPEVKDELDNVDATLLHCDTYKLHKLENDRNTISSILLSTYTNLAIDRCWSYFSSKIKNLNDSEAERGALIEDEAKNKMIRRDLIRQLRQQRNHHKLVVYDTDIIIEQLKTQVEDAALNAEIRCRYTDNWQRARTEQHVQQIVDKEASPSKSIEHYKTQFDCEERIHSEVELLINININETLEKIESWMEKYEHDIEKVDLKIRKQDIKYQSTVEKRTKLEDMLEKHEILIKDWVNFKDERARAQKYREDMNNAATTVQAWWRGLLVRLQLGPYKVVKKPAKPAPAEKKKKK